MRILQVIHDFMPHHVAGSELYCFYLSSELSKRHQIDVLFTERDLSRAQYSYRRQLHGRLTFHEVVHNREYRKFEHSYADPSMERAYVRLLEEIEPDVVHVHHLMNHSVEYPRLAKERGIKVVFTLHDYWLSCGHYGQRLRPGHGICDEIDVRACADCLANVAVMPPLHSTQHVHPLWLLLLRRCSAA